MEYPNIKRLTASDEVFKALHGWIAEKKLKPGDKLPSQDELAKQFKVSRNTLREAIKKLDMMGFVSTRHGVGTIVNDANTVNYFSVLSKHLLMDTASVTDFLEARISVEMTTVKLAAIRANSDDISRLEQIFVQQAEAIKEPSKFSLLDAQFHLELARTSKNQVMVKILETVWELLNRFIGEVSQLPGSVEKAFGYHRRILDCIISHDPQKAEIEILNHLLNVTRTVKKHINVNLEENSIFELASNINGIKSRNTTDFGQEA